MQHVLYGTVSRQLASGSLLPSADQLGSAKLLLDTFVTYGFNDALENDDYLHTLMFGEGQIVDKNQIVATNALSATQPITGSALLNNARVQLTQTGDKRCAALKERGQRVLDAIGAATHEELIGMIVDAQKDLRLAQMIDSQIEPEPGSAGRRILCRW